ncbi:tRNA 2-selenouridine(34) synthase MnmH [Jeotgalibacillus salarius]|uniref:tRNA 2-selenouridine(34) synthase MnmH n=1 Tax=Jeotgalibacillus salarius TaxID=546023 RepID=A0A4Y8LIW3_9BACL|nr:tRNA 2-selenouridine(34) synthase MnmH [Jeotgalibacillus salarius]TFE01631.1 tRNA 2-selenouridine(34) synthase MnmH [Jeotgalibacillus salarius]
MTREITLNDLMEAHENSERVLVDVRSQGEFEEGSIPGSVNIPVFNNEERAEIGTIYKQVGQEAAKERGLEIFSAKLPEFVKQFRELGSPVSVFCWRGGMRSKTAATTTELMGVDVNRLTGGIRTYRQWVVQSLEAYEFKPQLLVLNGYTGSGKTLILNQLKDHGYPIMDLEKMAGHRGSIFGQIGLEPSNQKKFDSLLITELRKLKESPYIFIEGESRRIGRVHMPEFLHEKKEKAPQLFLDLPAEVRVQNIMQDYQPEQMPEQFMEAFEKIERRIHTPISREIRDLLTKGDFAEAVRLLLVHYYDPRYEHSISSQDGNHQFIKAESMEEAYEKVKAAADSFRYTSSRQ